MHGSEGGVGKRASAPRPAPTHLEETYGLRPPHGVLVTGDGKRVRVKNTAELRERVLAVAARIREARRRLDEEVPVSPPDWQCRSCGLRSRCRQARG